MIDSAEEGERSSPIKDLAHEARIVWDRRWRPSSTQMDAQG